MKVTNPILKGFHPDPSAVRVGDDYYVANSTFFWYPGIALHHSRDLVHWTRLPSPLTGTDMADLRGVSAAGGIWAPDLSYDPHRELFILLYTNVRSMYTAMYDTKNFMITARDIRGPWSAPRELSSYGFDPSLFTDTDGRQYLISMVTDHRVPQKLKGQLLLQEFDFESGQMKGEPAAIYQSTEIYLEGPHIYHIGEWYYLFAADTGTGEGHGESVLRAENVWGPYEMYRPEAYTQQERAESKEHEPGEAWSFLTMRHRQDAPIQKCGHLSLIDTPAGNWYGLYLCGRPTGQVNPPDAPRFAGERRYTLGRETAITPIEWTEDGWPCLPGGEIHPAVTVEIKAGDPSGLPDPETDDFERALLHPMYLSPYTPIDERHMTLQERPGYLRMYGRDGLGSRFDQSMLARRWPEPDFTAGCLLEFSPAGFKQMAGLILLYDTENYLYLYLSRDEEMGRSLILYRSENGVRSMPAGPVPVGEGPVELKVCVSGGEWAAFFWRQDTEGIGRSGGPSKARSGRGTWQAVGKEEDVSFLSDEACRDGWFTGAVAGICAQDLTGAGLYADFDWFRLTGRQPGPA